MPEIKVSHRERRLLHYMSKAAAKALLAILVVLCAQQKRVTEAMHRRVTFKPSKRASFS